MAPSPFSVAKSSASTPSLRSRDALASMDRGANVRVVVRVRAFLPREIERDAQCLVSMDPDSQVTTLHAPPAQSCRSRSRDETDRRFAFDGSFWSHSVDDGHYAGQEDVYNSLGEEFLDHNFDGYHTCIFAYGQTGAGKSYTMMGTAEQPGLIPRTCEDLFERIETAHGESANVAYSVHVSYLEVYNEHVRDLLVPVVAGAPPHYLKMRESPTEGPYVKDLTEVPVRSLAEILRHMKAGDASRTTASTRLNDVSSRSHAVFTIMLRQIHHDLDTDETTERSSRIRLVDLAGSERAKATAATGVRLREGANINKSLAALGRVMAALATDPRKRRRLDGGVVPYRDSVLTWLLKDSLGGNSKTAMIACIGPADYEETLSTLRYADQAKRIRTRAVVNQDQRSTAERDAQIAAMADEIRSLQLSVSDSRQRERNADREAEERLDAYQERVTQMQRMMEERGLVAESKIKKLQTENEALRIHLKLAIDSLTNPIPEVVVGKGERKVADEDDENRLRDDDSDGSSTTAMGDEDDEDDDDDDDGLQDEMRRYLQDVGNLRKLIGGDLVRFRDEESVRRPLGGRTNV
ncbi:hypothetical protein XA68_16433 [Ophiocordyceps unilateralis]|uniref:Kinesin-like protein n=1 Tax=Ophiocordyceps unilateralis TaxID=268505 RepID=A0A2A9P546_OPHUN|nr:hypothetical protein XA68_16433 [Ophiocordyceps unilateralis]